jgi:hypothetical protein
MNILVVNKLDVEVDAGRNDNLRLGGFGISCALREQFKALRQAARNPIPCNRQFVRGSKIPLTYLHTATG